MQEGWYENGQLKYRANWKNGKLDGLQEYWYENGQLQRRGNYKNGWKVPLPPQYEIGESNKNESSDNPFTPNTKQTEQYEQVVQEEQQHRQQVSKAEDDVLDMLIKRSGVEMEKLEPEDFAKKLQEVDGQTAEYLMTTNQECYGFVYNGKIYLNKANNLIIIFFFWNIF